jgi:hypothetical protein
MPTLLHTAKGSKRPFLLFKRCLAIAGQTSSQSFFQFLKIMALYRNLELLLLIMLPQTMFFVALFNLIGRIHLMYNGM